MLILLFIPFYEMLILLSFPFYEMLIPSFSVQRLPAERQKPPYIIGRKRGEGRAWEKQNPIWPGELGALATATGAGALPGRFRLAGDSAPAATRYGTGPLALGNKNLSNKNLSKGEKRI